MKRAHDSVVWVAAALIVVVQVVSTNLTGFGIGRTTLTYDDAALPRLAVALIGVLLVWLLAAWTPAERSGGLRLAIDPTLGALVALAVWAVVSALASKQGPVVWLGQSERLEGVLTIALYAVAFGAGLQVGRRRGALTPLAIALVAGGVVLAVHGVLQMALLDPTDYSVASLSNLHARYARASLLNANFLGTALVLSLPVAVWFTAESPRKPVRVVFGAVALLMVVALWGTESQSAWLTAVVQMGAACVVWLMGHGSRRSRAIVPAVVAGIVLITTVIGVSAVVPQLRQSISRSAAERLALARVALVATARDPLTGSGPDTFLAAFRSARDAGAGAVIGAGTTENNAHSWPLQFSATLGIPGALLLVAAVFLALWRTRPLRDREHLAPARAASASVSPGLMAALWIGVAGAAFNLLTSVAMIAFTIPFWLLLGAMAAPAARSVELSRVARAGVAFLAGLLLVAGAAVSVRLIAADRAYLESRIAFRALDHARAIERADAAARLNPTSVKYGRGAAQARVQYALETAKQTRTSAAWVTPPFQDALRSIAVVEQRWPGDYPVRCWSGGMQGWFGVWFGDEELKRAAQAEAQAAADLDRLHREVTGLASGVTTPGALNSALSVPGLP